MNLGPRSRDRGGRHGARAKVAPVGLRASTLLGALLCLACCSSAARHRALTFFFEGVDQGRAQAKAAPLPGTSGPMTNQERADALGYELSYPTFHIHEPYREKKCDGCHVNQPGATSTFSWDASAFVLRKSPEELCLGCHEVPDAVESVHGPVAAGDCMLCHEHHLSPYPKLLRHERTQDLCHQCHVPGDTLVTTDLHAGFGDQSCTECHDPHWSEHPGLRKQ